MTINITLQRTLDDEFLSDVLITAFDGGVGACWYWCNPDRKGGSALTHTGTGYGDPDYRWISMDIKYEDIVNDGWIPATITHEMIGKGIQLAIDGEFINDSIKMDIMRAVSESDCGYIDAEAADCIVQLGLFGEVIFG